MNKNSQSPQEEFLNNLERYIDARIRVNLPNQDNEHYHTSFSEKTELLDSLNKLFKNER